MIEISLIFLGFCFMGAFLAVLYRACMGQPKAIMIYLAIVIFFIDSSFRSRGISSDTSLDPQSLLKLVIFMGCFAIGALHAGKYLNKVRSASAFWMLLFILWSIITTVFSPIPQYTFAATLSFLGLYMFCLVVTQKLTNRQILYTIAWSLGLLIVFSWGAYLLNLSLAFKLEYTSGGVVKRFAGLGGAPNSMGRLASIFLLTLFLIFIYKLAKIKDILISSGVGGLTLLMTWSRSSMLALISVVATYYLRKRPFLLLCAILFIIFIFMYYEMSTSSNMEAAVGKLSRSGSITELYSFTGRTAIWAFVWDQIVESPIVGHGYASSRVIITSGFHTKWGFTSTMAHNMFLQCLLDLGIVGLLFFSLALFNNAIRWLRNPSPIVGTTLVYMLFHGFFESGPIGSIPNVLSFFLILSFFWKDDKTLMAREPDR